MIDQYQQKKQLETLLVAYFRQGYPEFPDCRIAESESPDFLVTLKNKSTLGIELTRLYPVSQQPLSEQESMHVKTEEDLVNNTRFLFESKSPIKCFVKFLFSKSERLKPEQVFSASVRIFRMILESINDFDGTRLNLVLIRKGLPQCIESILVLSHPRLGYQVWERVNNLGTSSDLLADIRLSIHKKDEKFRIYLRQNLDDYWLLITTDLLIQEKPVNIPNLFLNTSFSSEFKKVFILEVLTGKVLTLI